MKHWTDDTSDCKPSSLQRASSLLNQQIWCWGRDIECVDGNLLVQHGFQRINKPASSDAASLYRLELSPTARIILRGFGVYCGDERWGGLFLRRFKFIPQLTPEPDLVRPAWSVEDLPLLELPRADQLECCQRLLLMLIDWIREYEVWIAERVGIAYRQDTLLDWQPQNDTVVPGEEMAVAWRMLSEEVTDNPEQFIRNQR